MDSAVKTALAMLISETPDNSEIIIAMYLLKKHRPRIFNEIGRDILCQLPDENLEEIFDIFAEDSDDKKMAWHIISIWDIRPEVAEKIDKKYSLKVKESINTEQ